MIDGFVFPFFLQTISTSLIRDKSGLGFSIAGGRDSDSFKTNDHVSIYTTTSLSSLSILVNVQIRCCNNNVPLSLICKNEFLVKVKNEQYVDQQKSGKGQ